MRFSLFASGYLFSLLYTRLRRTVCLMAFVLEFIAGLTHFAAMLSISEPKAVGHVNFLN